MNQAISFVSTGFSWLIEKMDDIFLSIPGAFGLIISIFAIYVSIRLLLKPIFGGSDRVRKVKGKEGGEDS